MSLPKQIKKVKYEFASGTGVVSSGEITLNDYEINIAHENPLGNPTYSKSLNGYLVPYAVKGRVKFDMRFSKMVGNDIATTYSFFNNVITYHNSTSVIMNLYYKWMNNEGATSAEKMAVVLESPVEMVQKYTSQIGSYSPSISFISQELLTSIPTSLQGV